MEVEDERSLKRKHSEDDDDEEEEDDIFAADKPKEKKQKKDKNGSDSEESEDRDDARDKSESDEEEKEAWRQQAEQSRRKKRKLAAKNAGVEGLSESEEEEEDYTGEKEFTLTEQEEHGEKLEPFNLNEEIEDRVINVEKGSVNTALGKDLDEAWLQDYDQNIKDNRQFAHKMAALQQKITAEADAMNQEPEQLSNLEKLKLLDTTAEALLWGESVGEALNRLRPPHQKKVPKGRQSSAPKEQTPFDSLAEKADTLMSQLGINTIYELTKEEVLDKLDQVKAKLVKWQYQWEGSAEEFGPFTIEEMQNWNASGYFAKTEGGAGLFARQLVAGKPTTQYMPVESVDFDKIYD